MSNRFHKVCSLICGLTALLMLAGCASGGNPVTTPAATSANPISTETPYQWPITLNFVATGSSGEAKMVSWASAMQADLKGPIIRVVNEAAWTNTYKRMAANEMVLAQVDKSTLRDTLEAINEYAMTDGGPWAAGLVWVDSLAATGFMVRGDSDIFKPEDIKPGTRIAIWNDKSATLNPFRSLLAWGKVSEKDIVWIKTGDYDAGPRAVTEGRADICMAAPVSPAVTEASAAPRGIRYIALDPRTNPEGAKAFLDISPLYDFGPINAGPKNIQGTWGIISYKYVGANLATDSELVYNIAKWLDNNYALYKDRYESNANMTLDDLLKAMDTSFIPVHPGLVKYLKEKGIWNQDYESRNVKNSALVQQYIDAFKEAKIQAEAKGIEIKPNNPQWIELWENYKQVKQIPVIKMHVSLTQDAAVSYAAGYIPESSPSPTAPSGTSSPAPSATPVVMEFPIEILNISDAHPGDDVTVNIKTEPGAEVTILFTMPNGTKSGFPQDNVKIAGADGVISWTWNINSRVPAGEAIYTFTATLEGKHSTLIFKKKI